MKKMVIGLMAATSFMLSSAAIAAPPISAGSYSGIATVQKGSGPILDCDISFDLSGSPLVANNVTIAPGHPYCATIQVTPGPYSVTVAPGGASYTVHGVFADTTITPGNCLGDISVVWDASIGGWVVNASMAPVVAGTGSCTIIGEVY
jgi:hypothetical protein